MMDKIPLQWRRAAFLAIAIYLMLVALVVWQPTEITGAQLPGDTGIAVALGPAGRAPGATDPQAETEQFSELVTQSEPETPPEAIEAESKPVAELIAQPQPAPQFREPIPEPPKPVTGPATPVANEPREIAKIPDVASPPAARPAGAAGQSGDRDADETGNATADADSGGGDPGVKADYMAVLRAWLETHKKYPRRAQMRRQEGTALLFFIIDKNGEVIEFKLHQSSGYAALDREVTEMLKRAQPLPRIPPEMQKAQLPLLVPVQFYLR